MLGFGWGEGRVKLPCSGQFVRNVPRGELRRPALQLDGALRAMADLDLTQAEADALIEMEKHSAEAGLLNFPAPGGRLVIPLVSADKREHFLLNVTRFQIKVTKATYQTRARQAVVLIRLDLEGPPHRNPDGQEIPCPHLHLYREGYGDKWAIPAPVDRYPDTSALFQTFEAFMQHCNITQQPDFQAGLF
jgi:hypothetical protein